jgi:3-hydroxyacyl-[acyl-carrier-protein] dehydratase
MTNNTEMTTQEILSYLPHRPPFLLIDRVIEVKKNSLIAIKNVTIDEWFFTGHFPGQPIMPGVLILEALAQASAVLGFKLIQTQPQEKGLYLFAGIDNARFKRIVQPGDQLILKVELIKFRKNLLKISGTAMVDNDVACTAELLSIKKEDDA